MSEELSDYQNARLAVAESETASATEMRDAVSLKTMLGYGVKSGPVEITLPVSEKEGLIRFTLRPFTVSATVMVEPFLNSLPETVRLIAAILSKSLATDGKFSLAEALRLLRTMVNPESADSVTEETVKEHIRMAQGEISAPESLDSIWEILLIALSRSKRSDMQIDREYLMDNIGTRDLLSALAKIYAVNASIPDDFLSDAATELLA